MPKSKKTPSVDDFSDEEKAQIQRYGSSLSGPPTDFDNEVERQLRAHEANYQKMRQAQTGGSVGLAPTEMEQQQIKQREALQQQATTQGAVQAAQTQSQQVPVNPPEAPSGPAGTSIPYPAQRGAQASPGAAAGRPGPASPAPPAAPGSEGEEGPEEEQ